MLNWMNRRKYVLIALGVLIIAFLSLPVVRFEESTNTILENADHGRRTMEVSCL